MFTPVTNFCCGKTFCFRITGHGVARPLCLIRSLFGIFCSFFTSSVYSGVKTFWQLESECIRPQARFYNTISCQHIRPSLSTFVQLCQTMGVLPFCEVAHLFQEVHKPFGFVRGGSLAIWRAPGVPQMLQGLSTAALRTSKWLPKGLRSTSRELTWIQ